MSESTHFRRRLAAAVAVGCAGLALASTAGAVDLRDWGRKFSPDQRFVVLAQFNNQAVLDKETQLVWQRSPGSTPWSYGGADYTGCTISAIGGRFGWRLPSRFELMTLLDPNAPAPVKLPAGHPFLGVTPDGYYWTNSRATNPDPAYDEFKVVVNVGSAIQSTFRVDNVSNQFPAWCVRGQSQ